jgi:hypothetical protein
MVAAMGNHLHQDGLGNSGLSISAFSKRTGLSNDAILRYCRQGKVFGARKHPLTKKWWIYPPAKLLCQPRAKSVNTSTPKGSMLHADAVG